MPHGVPFTLLSISTKMNIDSVVIVWQFDPLGSKNGGIGKYILSLITHAPRNFRFSIVGVTGRDVEIGRWEKILIGGAEVMFLPVCRISDENVKSIIPLSFRFVLSLLRSKGEFVKVGRLYLQRFTYILPFLFGNEKITVMCHTDLARHLSSQYGFVGRLAWFFLGRIYLKRCARVFSVNNKTIKFLGDYLPKYKEKFVFFPTWADPDLFVCSKPVDVFEDSGKSIYLKKVIIFVGRLQSPKQPLKAIEVIAKLGDDFLLVVAGDGNLKFDMEQLAIAKKVSHRVRFLGSVEHSRLPALYEAADIYLSTSDYEGMSISLLEALQMGIPVVTTPTGESATIVNPKLNGRVADGFSSDELSSLVLVVASSNYTRPEIVASVNQFNPKLIVEKTINGMMVL